MNNENYNKNYYTMNKNNYCVAVVGDGALTGGMAYEAFNNVIHH